jgi:hypothetical protein
MPKVEQYREYEITVTVREQKMEGWCESDLIGECVEHAIDELRGFKTVPGSIQVRRIKGGK